jgi:hypothetical protein
MSPHGATTPQQPAKGSDRPGGFDLTLEDSDLVAKNQDFGVFGAV